MKCWCPLSILTDEVSQDLGAAIRFAQEFELDGIELRSLHGKAFRDLTPAEIREVRQRCDDAGLRVSGVATPVFKCQLEAPEEIREHVELFKRSVEAAQVLGCEIVRVFAFLRRSHPATSEELARAAGHFPALLEAARGSGTRSWGSKMRRAASWAPGRRRRSFFRTWKARRAARGGVGSLQRALPG